MADIAIASDNIRNYSQDRKDLDYFIGVLKNAGHTITDLGVGPNKLQNHMNYHRHDWMILIGGGLCVCTLGDFVSGIRRQYYYAKKATIIFNTVAIPLNAKTWICEISWDAPKCPEGRRYFGMTLPKVHEQEKDVLLPFADGESIEECAKNFMAALGGGTASTTAQQVNTSSSALDLIKQVCSDWDPYGIDLDLHGDTVTIKKTNPKKTEALNTSNIVNNSVSYADYDSATPNTNGSSKDQYLVDRFGTVPLQTEITDQQAQVLQMAKRGHNHSIDLKCILNEKITAGSWVSLTLDELGLTKRPYYVSKAGISEDRTQTLTLTDGPPSLYVEITETATEEEETSEEEESTEEET